MALALKSVGTTASRKMTVRKSVSSKAAKVKNWALFLPIVSTAAVCIMVYVYLFALSSVARDQTDKLDKQIITEKYRKDQLQQSLRMERAPKRLGNWAKSAGMTNAAASATLTLIDSKSTSNAKELVARATNAQ